MNADALRFYYDAIEARRNAHSIMRSRLPGWKLYHRAAMRRAISKWQQFRRAMA